MLNSTVRIALISDLHGNLVAAEAVRDALAAAAPDQIVCLGDVALFGPQPRETLALVRKLGCLVVMGNTDAWALDPRPAPGADDLTLLYNAIEGWGAALLTDEDQAFIRTFQPVVRVDLGAGAALLCYHGSPRSFDEEVSATLTPELLDEVFSGVDAILCAGGHTHTPMMLRHRHRLVINPGSVGLPFEMLADGSGRNPPWAEYAIIEYRGPDDLSVELRRTRVDLAQILAAAHASGMPMVEQWAADWR